MDFLFLDIMSIYFSATTGWLLPWLGFLQMLLSIWRKGSNLFTNSQSHTWKIGKKCLVCFYSSQACYFLLLRQCNVFLSDLQKIAILFHSQEVTRIWGNISILLQKLQPTKKWYIIYCVLLLSGIAGKIVKICYSNTPMTLMAKVFFFNLDHLM